MYVDIVHFQLTFLTYCLSALSVTSLFAFCIVEIAQIDYYDSDCGWSLVHRDISPNLVRFRSAIPKSRHG